MYTIATFVILACAWAVGDFEPRTKMYITLAFLCAVLLGIGYPVASLLAQTIFCLAVGAFTFAGTRGRR